MQTKIPNDFARRRIQDSELSVRAKNALRSRGIDTFGQLAQFRDEELLEIYAFGRKCLGEVRDAIARALSCAHLSEGPLIEENALTTRSGDRSFASPGGWKVPRCGDEILKAPVDLLDLSTRPARVLTRLRISTLGQLLTYPKRELGATTNMGRKSIAEIEAKLNAYISADLNRGAEHVDGFGTGSESDPASIKEYIDQILGILPERTRNVLADRYGLWDGISETLQDIGDKLGLTRERIRQLEASGLKRIRRLYGYGPIADYINRKTRFLLAADAEKYGVVTEDEIAAAMGCTVEEAELAFVFLHDVTGEDILSASLAQVEPGIYRVRKESSINYQEMLRLLQQCLQAREKPLAEGILIKEAISRAGSPFSPDKVGLAHRILSISPTISRLRNGTIALSEWVEYQGRDATSLAEAALRLVGRPAHFREITVRLNSLLQEQESYNERTIHHALIADETKFVRVKSGTYGLVKWGLKKPPYVKDRLIELLSATNYPLPLWHLQEKVLEVCNCRLASIQMTLDLNPTLFTRFEGDQYGLRQHHAK